MFDMLSLSGALLCAAFFFAGIVDGVVGGGGLLTLPTFMAIGFPVHFISGTNQCCTFLGAITSFYRYLRSGHVHWPSALMTAPLTIIGATLGARLNLFLPEAVLERVMLFLLPVITLILIFKRDFGSENRSATLTTRHKIGAALFIGIVLGAYQGFYAAGAGTFFLIGFCILYRLDLLTASGTTRFICVCSGLTSSITYALSGNVMWSAVIPGMLCNMLGNYLGAGLATTRGARFIRPLFLGMLALLFVRLIFTMF